MTPEEIEKLPYRQGVGVMLVNPAGKVFAGERIDTPGAWQMPQGGIDRGEDPERAALRELQEETGVMPGSVRIEARTADWVRYDLPHELVPNLWKGRFRGQEQLWYLLRFHGSDDEVVLDADHPEFSAWRWVPPAEITSLIVPFKRALYAQVLDEFSDRLSLPASQR